MAKSNIKLLFLIIAAMVLFLLIGGSWWLYTYVKTTTALKLEHLSHEKSYDIRYKLIHFYDWMMFNFEETKSEPVKKLAIAQRYFDRYGTNAPLEPLQKLLNTTESSYDISLINSDLVIERTTFPPDLKLDLKPFPFVAEVLRKEFSDPRLIDTSLPLYEDSGQKFKRHITQLSRDRRSIIRLSQSLRDDGSIKKFMSNLHQEVPTLSNSSLITLHSENTKIHSDYVKEIWSSETERDHKNRIPTEKLKETMIKLEPTSSAIFNGPDLFLYSYMDILFKNNTYTEALYWQNGRYFHLVMFPFQSFYHHHQKSYSFLILEFDETDAYENTRLVQTTIFTIWSLAVVLILLTMIIMYRRIIAPIRLLQKHMHEQTPVSDPLLLSTEDEISKMSRTYNWLLGDLKEQILKNKTILLQFKAFTANVIHQVRTPLSVIKIALEMLEESKDNIGKLHIHSSVVTMEHLYNSLAFTLQNEDIELPVELNLDTAAIVAERIKLFEPVAQSLDTVIELDIQNTLPIDMNRMEFEFLVDNNLSNALKYGEPCKPIRVSLQLSPHELTLVFASYGKEIIDKNGIFERYIRHDSSKQGNGIGLNIVSSICKRYHIIIQLTYEEGKNCFHYRFPLKT